MLLAKLVAKYKSYTLSQRTMNTLIKTNKGKTYAVLCANDCSVETSDGQVILEVTANQQGYFVAPFDSAVCTDDSAIVTESFNSAPATQAASGGANLTQSVEGTVYAADEDAASNSNFTTAIIDGSRIPIGHYTAIELPQRIGYSTYISDEPLYLLIQEATSIDDDGEDVYTTIAVSDNANVPAYASSITLARWEFADGFTLSGGNIKIIPSTTQEEPTKQHCFGGRCASTGITDDSLIEFNERREQWRLCARFEGTYECDIYAPIEHTTDSNIHLSEMEQALLNSACNSLNYEAIPLIDDELVINLEPTTVPDYQLNGLTSLSITDITVTGASDNTVVTAEIWLTTGDTAVVVNWPEGVEWYNNDSYYNLAARKRYSIKVQVEPDGKIILYTLYDYTRTTSADATITSVGVFFPSSSSSVYGRRFARYSDGTTKWGSYVDGTFTDATGLEYCTYLAASTTSTSYTLENGTKNDFDSLFPWSHMKRETIEGQTMILVPKFAMRVLSTSIAYDSYDADGVLTDQLSESGMLIEISTNDDPDSVIGDGDSDFRISRAFGRPDGTFMDWYGIGAYEASSTTANGISCLGSVTGASPKVSTNRETFTTLAKALNVLDDYDDSSWNITTIYETQEIMIPLMWVESACRSTQHAYGQGFASMSSVGVTGKADVINYYYPATPLRSGNIASSTTGTSAVVYRGIENPWGNVWKNVNGLHVSYGLSWDEATGNNWLVQGDNDRTKMGVWATEETLVENGYVSLGYAVPTSSNYVTAVGIGNLSFLPVSTSSTATAATYYGDYTYNTSSTVSYRTPFFGGCYNKASICGSVSWYFEGSLTDSYFTYGARLSLAF